MARSASETHRRALAYAGEHVRQHKAFPTVRDVMDGIGMQSPDVVSRAIRECKETMLDEAISGGIGGRFSPALLKAVEELQEAAQKEGLANLEQKRMEWETEKAAVAAAYEGAIAERDAARREIEAERHNLAIFKAAAAEAAAAQEKEIHQLRDALHKETKKTAAANATTQTVREAIARLESDLKHAEGQVQAERNRASMAAEEAADVIEQANRTAKVATDAKDRAESALDDYRAIAEAQAARDRDRVTHLEKRISSLESRNEHLTDEVMVAKATAAETQATLSAQIAAIDELRPQLATHIATVESLREQLAATHTQLTEAQSTISARDTEIRLLRERQQEERPPGEDA